MPLVCLLVIAILCTTARPADGQTWLEAYQSGDYARAAALLQPIVAEANLQEVDDDPAPPEHLATMYARGLGVDRDPVLACALAQQAEFAANTSAHRYARDVLTYNGMLAARERFTAQHCAPLSGEERVAAGQSIGCYAFGLSEQVLTVGPHTVRVSRQRQAPGGATQALSIEWGCAQFIAGFRTVAVPPPPDALPEAATRFFLEMVSWHVGQRPEDKRIIYFLQWKLYEVAPGWVRNVAMVELASVPHWPGPEFPPELGPAVTLQMIRTGHVRWRVEGAPPRRGWIMRPEAQTP